MTRRWRLFPKYALLIITLVGGMLIVSGAIGIYFSYRETEAHLVALQVDKAESAATRIEQYVLDIEHQLSWTALPRTDSGGDALDQRRIEYLKLLRQAPAITEVVWLDAFGHEQLRISRLAMDAVSGGADLSKEPKFKEAIAGHVYYGPVYFRKGTEPYMTISRPAGSGEGVTAAEVNLKFVWDVVSRIKIGETGLAYVIDGSGTLIAHPDISLVLKKSDLKLLPQVAALATPADSASPLGRDLNGAKVFSAHSPISTLHWTVFVESPRAEAFAPLYTTLQRMALVLVVALLISMAASFLLARTLVRPLRALQAGAAQIGAGDLDRRIEVHTGDELEGLAEQFNHMSAQLRESYAGLERKVEQRTVELTEALEYQTATAEILKVISNSPTDVQPILEAVAERSLLLCRADGSRVWLLNGDHLRAATGYKLGDGTDAGRNEVLPLRSTSVIGRSFVERRTVHVEDIAALIDSQYPDSRAIQARHGFRTVLAVPMLREGAAVGTIAVLRTKVQSFSKPEIRLVETFADQAVIAIENVRLLSETKAALEQQRASAKILSVISNSVADTTPVFAAILQSCEELFGGLHMTINLVGEDGLVRLAAHRGYLPNREEFESTFPIPLSPESGSGAAILSGRVMHYPDVEHGEDVPPYARGSAKPIGIKSLVFAPLLWEGRGVGAIIVGRRVAGPFADKDIALLKTFADQAVIAIQNSRLFNEIQAKSRELEMANKHKSEFLANMSHELRTPLNAIIGFSEVLSEKMFGDLNDKQLEYLLDIHTSGHHLLSLINDILDLSKIEAGRMELDLASVNLPMLLDNCTTLVRERASRQGLALALEVESGVGDWVADIRKLKQIVINLLSNAVKFTPAGGCVTLRARRLGPTVEIAVVDTGVGIAPDQQALVFEEFRQAGGDYLRKSEGSGLGLSLAKRFVELHGGSMRVDSVPGKGSTFAFILPDRVLEAV